MGRQTCILVIDDDAGHLDILATLLKHHGYAVLVENTPAAGFATACRAQPDAVLLGLHFGGAPAGLGLIDRLRSSEQTAWMPIVVVSSFLDVHQDDLRERRVAHVPKGGDLTRVVSTLQAMLRNAPPSD